MNGRGAGKRTAFAEKSTKIQVHTRAARDDSTIPSKMALVENGMPAVNKHVPLLVRPTHNTTSVSSGIKSFVSSAASSILPGVARRDAHSTAEMPHTKKLTVREDAPPALAHNGPPFLSSYELYQPLPEIVPAEPLGTIHTEVNIVQPVAHANSFKQASSAGSEWTGITEPVVEANQAEDDPTTGSKEDDAAVWAAAPEHTEDMESPAAGPHGLDHHAVDRFVDAVDDQTTPPLPQVSTEERLRQSYSLCVPPPGYDQVQEYWDDDEDDDDDDGYTTKSYKSRDYTSGNVSLLLTVVPKLTEKAKKELAAARALVGTTIQWDERDDDDEEDISLVSEYAEEIFTYMRALEVNMMPNANYISFQNEISWSMRGVLIDWIVQVHSRFTLLPETLYLCVNIIDRFLSRKIVSLGKFQLVGATALFIAAKYEEINCPSVQEIAFMVDGGYTVEEIIKAERFMLSLLEFELGFPGPMSFLRRISKADDYDLTTRTMAKYFLELSIMDERFLGSPPSFLAAGAHCLARLVLGNGNWTPHHVFYSDYTYGQLYPLIRLMINCCNYPGTHHGTIYRKYQDKRYHYASMLVRDQICSGFQVPGVSTLRSNALVDMDGNKSFWQPTN